MKYINILFLSFAFSSCSSASVVQIGMGGLIAIFGLMLLLFALMFFLIAKRKKDGEKSMVKFNNDILISLNKLSTNDQKIHMLEVLIERIINDEKYKADTEWQNKVLAKTYSHLATAYYKKGDEIQTLNTCSKIIELDPTDGMNYYNRGSIYSNRAMYEKALSDLNHAIELMPDYASAYNNRGLVYEKTGHYNEAIADFDKAIKLEESPIAYYNRGNTYCELNQYDNALQNYHWALQKLDIDKQSDLKKEIEEAIKILEKKE